LDGLRRAIQKNIETQLGFQLLEGKVREGQTVLVYHDQSSRKLVFNPQSSPDEPKVVKA
jgi:ATP-dependent Clp protease ATP-binding subunit ClpA